MDDVGSSATGLPVDTEGDLKFQYGQKPSRWTDEKVELLKTLWASGLCAKEIGNALGFTKNAVIGKVRRSNLPFRRDMPKGRAPGLPKPRVRKTKPSFSFARNVIIGDHERITDLRPEDIPLHQRKQVHELEDCHCRWPLGSPTQSDFFFCGDPTANLLEGRSYCARHARLAYRVMPRAYWSVEAQ